MNMASSNKGASNDQISQLPSWRHKEAGAKLELGNASEGSEKLINEDPVSGTISTYRLGLIWLVFFVKTILGEENRKIK